MLQSFTPVDKEDDLTEHHKLARAQTLESADTKDDKDFTVEETRKVVASMNKKKAPGEDVITGEVFDNNFDIYPKYVTAMYNACLRKGVLAKRWKTAKLIPIVKDGKENRDEVPKFRPISLLNTGRKVLEKLIINRINHHVFPRDIIIKNLYGFTPQRAP